jgi:hypothetical protein
MDAVYINGQHFYLPGHSEWLHKKDNQVPRFSNPIVHCIGLVLGVICSMSQSYSRIHDSSTHTRLED